MLKYLMPSTLCFALISCLCWADQKPFTLEDKISYCYGAQVGDSLKSSNIDLKIFENGLTAAITGNQADLSADQMAEVLAASAKAKRENKDLVYQGYAREKFDTATKEFSYAQGHKMGSKLREENITVSVPVFMSAVKAKVMGQEMLLTSEDQVKAMNENAAAHRTAAQQ